MQINDFCYLKVKAGNGGDGALAWRREAHVAKGGPFGGDGGDGGDVIFVGDENVNNLFHLRNLKKITAKNGENGANKGMHGHKAENLYIKVPCGTIITDSSGQHKFFDIVYHNQEQLICKGGKGGRGNLFFKSNQNQAPTLYERGDLGEELEIKLEIQSIADVGLLGFPNAGKSTFLASFSNAKPKIAPYPFTTLKPVLGVIEHNNTKLVFADIPGLIENAHQGSGLGFDFLKHLNRCQVLLHLIDANDEHGIVGAFKIIDNEIKQYSHDLYSKPRIIAINKCEHDISEEVITELMRVSGKNIHLISLKNNTNTQQLLNELFTLVTKVKNKIKSDEVLEINTNNIRSKTPDLIEVVVEKNQYGYNVIHPNLAYWVYKIPQNTIGNRLRLKQKFQTWKVNEKLIEAGAQKGDTISCYGLVWTFLNHEHYGDDEFH